MNTGSKTTVTGAAVGAATGSIVVYLAEILSKVDIPTAVEGSVIVVITALVGLVWPVE